MNPVSSRINRLLISRCNLQSSETERRCKSVLVYNNKCFAEINVLQQVNCCTSYLEVNSLVSRFLSFRPLRKEERKPWGWVWEVICHLDDKLLSRYQGQIQCSVSVRDWYLSHIPIHTHRLCFMIEYLVNQDGNVLVQTLILFKNTYCQWH